MNFDNVTFSGGVQIIPPPPAPAGQQAYTTPGTYSWTCPESVYTVSVVCIGGGGSGAYGRSYTGGAWPSGGGGGLGYKNNISVNPGQTYTVVVGAGTPAVTMTSSTSKTYPSTPAGDSYFISTSTVKGGAGGNATAGGPGQGGTYVGDGGGNGGNGAAAGGGTEGSNAIGAAGGGGAGGYSGNGGNAKSTIATSGSRGDPYGTGNPGTGGGGGAGAGYSVAAYNSGEMQGGCGGGTGILGQGSNGAGGVSSTSQSSVQGGGGGSSGANGSSGSAHPGTGGSYGGGGGGFLSNQFVSDHTTCAGGGGAVRIIWPGSTGITRAFPSTNTGNL